MQVYGYRDIFYSQILRWLNLSYKTLANLCIIFIQVSTYDSNVVFDR